MRRADLAFFALIVGIALALRVWAPWDEVFKPDRVNLLETDGWYHVRLIEHQVRNFPHHLTYDPYVGQYVAVGPLLDALLATVVVVTAGTQASTVYIERVAALGSPVIGVLAVLAVGVLASKAFGRREAMLAALLAAILPGHFLDRSLLGFLDHHALEVWLAFSVLAALVAASRGQAGDGQPTRWPIPDGPAVVAGVFLGLYLLAWTSAAMLVGILTAWVITLPFLGARDAVHAAARAATVASAVALATVLVFQDPLLARYKLQLFALIVLVVSSALTAVLASSISMAATRLAIIGIALALAGVALLLAPEMVSATVGELSRFTPNSARMSVLEARPLFVYTGQWQWLQPWELFRTGFYLGAVGLVALATTVWRSGRVDHWLIVVFTAAMFVATAGQNRFGYYLVPACAVVMGWLAVRVLDWGGVPHAGNRRPRVRAWVPMQRVIAIVIVILAIAPNVMPAIRSTARPSGMADYWFDVMQALKTETPPPFGAADYYYQPYPPQRRRAPDYTVMNWWDQGYWIVQAAQRVPVSNPTQSGAHDAARFLVAATDVEANAILDRARSRYVVVDWELPFRELGNGALGGRFENLANFSGRPTADFYRACFAKDAGGWKPVWLFHEAYYQTMAYRLTVLGGAAVTPAGNTWVVHLVDRVDEAGMRFCEVDSRQVHPSAAEAQAAAARQGAGYYAVGLTPWQPAFPVTAVQGLRPMREFRLPEQGPTETPLARLFEVVRDP